MAVNSSSGAAASYSLAAKQDTATHLGSAPHPEGWILQVVASAPTAAHESGLQHCLGLAQGCLAGQLQSLLPLSGCWQVTLHALP